MPGVDPISAATAGLGVVEGAVQYFTARADEKKAKKELDSLHKPFYKIQDEYYNNRDIAGNLATGGTPLSELNYETTNSERGLSAGISATLQGGGSPSDIGRLQDVYSRSIDNTGAQSAAQHIDNIKYFMNANKDLAGQKNIKWSIDEDQPYENKLKEITQRRAAVKQNQANGINEGIGALTAFGTSQANFDLYGKLFDGQKPNNTGGSAPSGGASTENSVGSDEGVFV